MQIRVLSFALVGETNKFIFIDSFKELILELKLILNYQFERNILGLNQNSN